MSQSKKSNFLPLLLIGGGVAGAVLLYGVGTKKDKEDSSLFGGIGVGGSGDFFGNSGGTNKPTVIPPQYNASDIVKGYDSSDLGIEDYAYNRANPDAFTNPSEGGVNPENVYDDSGSWTFADSAILGITAAATVPSVVKGVKSVGSKVASSSVGQAVKSSTAKVSTTTAGRLLSTVGKGAGVLGLIGLVDTVFDITGLKEAHFSETGLTGNLQGVNTSFSTIKNSVTTDTATKESIGNMASTWKKTYESQKKGTTGSAGSTQTWESSDGGQIAIAGMSAADAVKYYEAKGDKATADKFRAVASASK